MSVFDLGSGFVMVATQLLPGVVAVVLALAAAVAARSKAMPALIGASGLAAALSLLGVLMQLQHFARVDNASAWYDTIDVYVACAIVLIVLTFGLNLVALVRGFRNQGSFLRFLNLLPRLAGGVEKRVRGPPPPPPPQEPAEACRGAGKRVYWWRLGRRTPSWS